MKLIIQIPCLNEEDHLPAALADLPREVEGFDEVEWLVIDDGSTDRTVDVARANGVHHIVQFPQNRGLAAAFQAGLDAAVKLGADAIVNTDADNQYRADSIPRLVGPILSGDADIVVGDRNVRDHAEFSWAKRRLQVAGSWVVRLASGTDLPDATSGFRAYTREAATQLIVVSRYTYTIESIIQAGRSRLTVTHVPIETNPKVRDSRLFSSNWTYIRRNALTIIRVFAAYQPLRFFGTIAALLFACGLLAFAPFVYDWVRFGTRDGRLQSLLLGAILTISAFQMLVVAILADLIGANRDTSQRVLERTRVLETSLGVRPTHLLDPAGDSSPDLGERERQVP
ncbi:MAG: glycosyltransferase family 2 protein [Acidimicrobiales bacterium]